MRRNFGHVAGLTAGLEQLPDERNRIELDPVEKDAYGMPVPRLSFELRENDRRLYAAMKNNVLSILDAAGATQVTVQPYRPGAGAHNTGTCRMGSDPKKSVLNTFCQSHDVPNLFVIDGSCFVTCGTANPALTIMAIATRASEYIAEEGRKGNLSVRRGK
jgi:choline dehydrogenase-like flavoprotein